MFKNVFSIVVATALMGTMAFATDRGRTYNAPNVNIVHQGQKQHQKQSQHQAQGQHQSVNNGVANNIVNKTRSVSAASINGGPSHVCVTGGWLTGTLGGCAPTRHAKVLMEAEAIDYAGGNQMAHLCMFNRRIARSQCSGVTNQNYNGSLK